MRFEVSFQSLDDSDPPGTAVVLARSESMAVHRAARRAFGSDVTWEFDDSDFGTGWANAWRPDGVLARVTNKMRFSVLRSPESDSQWRQSRASS